MLYFNQSSNVSQAANPELQRPKYEPGMFYIPARHRNFIQNGEVTTNQVTMTYGSGKKVEIITRSKQIIPCKLAEDPVEANNRICKVCGGKLERKNHHAHSAEGYPCRGNLYRTGC